MAFVLLIAGTVAGTAAAIREARQNAERRNVVASRQGVASLERSIDDVVRVLGGSAAIVGDDGEVLVEVFEAFADDAMALGELWSVALVGVVPHADRPAFEERIGGSIETLNDGALAPAPTMPQYFPVLGVRPDVADRSMIGFDFASDPARSAALRRAFASGRTAISGPTVLSAEGVQGIALIRPLLHRTGTDPRVVGFLAAGEPVERLSQQVEDSVGRSMRFAVVRGDEVVAGDPEVLEEPGEVRSAQLADETWQVAVRSVHGPDLALAWLVGGGGAAATVAMAALLLATQRHQRALAVHSDQLETSERRRRAERDLAGELAQALTADQVTATLIRHLPTAVGADRTTISLRDEDGTLVVLDDTGTPQRALDPDPSSWIVRTVVSGQPAWLHSPQDWRHDPVTGSVAGDARGLALVPFRAEDVVGLLIVSYGRYHILAEEEQEVLQTVALLAGRALARGRRYDTDHHAAVEFQRAALPSGTPVLDSLVVAARYRPAARGATVGGDWYDTVVLPDQRVLLVVGDVVGHGMAAAATMGRLRTASHVLASSNPDPGVLLEALSAQVPSMPDAFCTTVVCALIDPVHRTMRWARAGHLPPLLVGAAGAELLDQPGMPPLGVIDDAHAPVHQRDLGDDDLVLLYTDGIVERRDESIDRSLERLRIAATDLADLCPDEFCDALVHALVPEVAQRDDIAALAVRLPACIDITPDPAVSEDDRADGYGHADREPASAAWKEITPAGVAEVPAHMTSFAEALDGSTGTSQIGPARDRFERWLEGVGADEDTAAELAIVFSELAANAVTASPEGTHAYLRAHLDGTSIVLEAQNGSPQTTPSGDGGWDLTDPLRPGGRGLLIVTAYVDKLQIEPPDDVSGILVRCRRALTTA